jgi:Uma2 family endonuclease
MNATEVQTMSAEEFLALPESMTRMELIQGEVLMAPAPEIDHQRTVGYLHILLKTITGTGEVLISPVDVHLGEASVLQPDVLWLAPDTTVEMVEGKYLRGAPELVIEVLSPSTEKVDRAEKFHLYQQHGVGEYWLVSPAGRFVEVYRREEGKFVRLGVFGAGEQFESAVLGKTIPVSGILPAAE